MDNQTDEQLEAAIEEANDDGSRAMQMFGYVIFAAIVICAIVLGFVLGTLAR